MKVLFVGMGSAGQRHLRNLKQLAGRNLDLFALRTTRHNNIIADGHAEECASLEAHYGFRSFSDLSEALQVSPDVVFVTNPSSKHMEVALQAAHAGCDLFIEKPLSHSKAGVEELRRTVDSKQLVAMVAFQTRFHPLYAEVKAILRNNEYGKVLAAQFQWGTFLPDHHPYEDYRSGYAARKDLGGGVLLGLIHELDLICSFWGLPDRVHSVLTNGGELQIEAEDTASALLGFRDQDHVFPVSLSLSYAQVNEERTCKIQFERPSLYWDLVHHTLHLRGRDGPLIERSLSHLLRNTLFVAEMREFLHAIATRGQPSPNLDDGIRSLALAETIRASARLTGHPLPVVELSAEPVRRPLHGTSPIVPTSRHLCSS